MLTYVTPTCGIPGCSGHLGKFDDCLSEALWNMGTDYADEYGGDSSGPCGYSMLFLFDESTRLSKLFKHWSELYVPDFVIGSGTYVMLTEHDSGRIYRESFETEQEARAAFDAHDRAYGEWSEANGY